MGQAAIDMATGSSWMVFTELQREADRWLVRRILGGHRPPIALLPEASDLWLSPAEKMRQRAGMMRTLIREYLRTEMLKNSLRFCWPGMGW